MAVKPKTSTSVNTSVLKETKGDSSPKAASGKNKLVTFAQIDFPMPQDRREETTTGDSRQSLNMAAKQKRLQKGKPEEIVATIEDVGQALDVFRYTQLEAVIDAIVTNVYSAGIAFNTVIDPEKPESVMAIRQNMAFDKAAAAHDFDYQVDISDEDLMDEVDRLKSRISNELIFMEGFFKRCCIGRSFLETCILTGQDQELHGTAYWEVLRDSTGSPCQILWAPAWSIKAKPYDDFLTPVEVSVPVSVTSWAKINSLIRFKSYIQLDTNGNTVARYKEFGDPRVLSRHTGIYYKDLAEMLASKDEPIIDAQGNPITPQPATELLSFSLPTAISSVYGKGRWPGVYPNLKGSRDLEEENMGIITDRKIPQLFILVSGGKGIPAKDIERIQHQIEENAKLGKRSIYFLQAQAATSMAGTTSGTPTIKLERTKSEQYQDALGLQYLKHSTEKILQAYRMPKAVLGQAEDLSADVVNLLYQFAESQVYDPRRDLFSTRLNTTLLPDLGIHYVTCKMRSRTPREPMQLASMLNIMADAGILTPDECRQLACDIFNRDFKDLAGIWSKLPTRLLTGLLQTKNQLIAAALLGSDSEEHVIEKLQEALLTQLTDVKPMAGEPKEGIAALSQSSSSDGDTDTDGTSGTDSTDTDAD